MMVDNTIIIELKNAILKSRYQAARLVNRELILLYLEIGKKISVTAKKESWGSKVLEQISADLQKELPGLRGFSSGNLKKMRVFSDFWMNHLKLSSALSNPISLMFEGISSALPNQLSEKNLNLFFSVSFTHHYSIASKCESLDEAYFYLVKVTSEFWSYRHLEKQLSERLFQHRGKLPNNFKQIFPEPHFEKAIKTFKDEPARFYQYGE